MAFRNRYRIPPTPMHAVESVTIEGKTLHIGDWVRSDRFAGFRGQQIGRITSMVMYDTKDEHNGAVAINGNRWIHKTHKLSGQAYAFGTAYPAAPPPGRLGIHAKDFEQIESPE